MLLSCDVRSPIRQGDPLSFGIVVVGRAPATYQFASYIVSIRAAVDGRSVFTDDAVCAGGVRGDVYVVGRLSRVVTDTAHLTPGAHRLVITVRRRIFDAGVPRDPRDDAAAMEDEVVLTAPFTVLPRVGADPVERTRPADGDPNVSADELRG